MKNKNSEDTKSLNSRLDFNAKYSNNDFSEWLFKILEQPEYKSVLDVGCGTGKQTVWFSKKLGAKGRVCSFDISEESISEINSKNLQNVIAKVGSMDDADEVLDSFECKEFDLIHSSYSMYYAKEPLFLLKNLKRRLAKNGTLVISAPHRKNTFLDFLSQFQKIGQLNWDCLGFIDDIALGFAHNNFESIRTHIFVNNLFVTSIDDLMENYRSSTFYERGVENMVFQKASDLIKSAGFFHIQKNSKVLIATKQIINNQERERERERVNDAACCKAVQLESLWLAA